MSKLITYEEVKEAFYYDPSTGIFRWKNPTSVRNPINSIAGYRDTKGYIILTLLGKTIKAHRVAWLITYGNFPTDEIDHKNHIRDDNRIINLREATSTENSRNSRLRKDNNSGIMGVRWKKQINKWEVTIGINRKNIYLGIYSHLFDAACARKSADHKYGYHSNHGKII